MKVKEKLVVLDSERENCELLCYVIIILIFVV